jgi:hypothetical protein
MSTVQDDAMKQLQSEEDKIALHGEELEPMLVVGEEDESTEFDPSEFGGKEYEVSKREEFIDATQGTVIDKESLSPWEKIVHLAKQLNLELKDPNPSCKKCYGKGYDSIDSKTQLPIPCQCIFKEKVNTNDFMANTLATHNRKYRRNMDEIVKMQKRKIKEMEELKLRKISLKKAELKKKHRKLMIEKVRKINRKKKR